MRRRPARIWFQVDGLARYAVRDDQNEHPSNCRSGRKPVRWVLTTLHVLGRQGSWSINEAACVRAKSHPGWQQESVAAQVGTRKCFIRVNITDAELAD